MLAWLCAIIVWPPSTSCGPRSSVPPVTRTTEVQPSFSFWDSSVWVSSSMSMMLATLTWANAVDEHRAESATSASVFFMVLLDPLVGGEGHVLGHLALGVHAHVDDADGVAVGRQDVGEHLGDLAALLVDDLVDAVV